jgi:beta-glucanase (GH16 family)
MQAQNSDRIALRKLYLNLCVLFLPLVFLFSCGKSSMNTVTPTPVTKTTTTTTDTAVTPVYSLIWSDEFNGTAVDTTKWNFETGNLGVNQEQEYYQAAHATVANGNLVITARQQNAGNFYYTSARINSANKVTALYGRIEARIALPIVQGLWPAFWMLGADINNGVTWPSCGEIDIMEHVNTDSLIYGTIHWNSGGAAQYGSTTSSTPSAYHIYAVEWDANAIRWYVDNTLYVTANIANNINNTGCFHNPFFIILNLAVGGTFPGSNVGGAQLPASMYVDYVRVYKQTN